MTRGRTAVAAALACVSTGACADAAGEGTLAIRIYGEPFIEQGIDDTVFVDGWSTSFSRFLVAIDQVSAGDSDDDGRYLFDLVEDSAGDGREITRLVVPAGAQELAYRIAPGDAAAAGNASVEDRATMAQMGWSMFVEGVARNDTTEVAFAWGFGSTASYRACEVAQAVPDGGEATTTITIHADHLYYDDLESSRPNVAFALIAASDADLDGTVTAAELAARDIATEARYQVGSHDIHDLWAFMTFLSRTVGHIDGEGECTPELRNHTRA